MFDMPFCYHVPFLFYRRISVIFVSGFSKGLHLAEVCLSPPAGERLPAAPDPPSYPWASTMMCVMLYTERVYWCTSYVELRCRWHF